jgi:hypothetical protein
VPINDTKPELIEPSVVICSAIPVEVIDEELKKTFVLS